MSAVQKRFRFSARDLLVLFDALAFQFNFFMVDEHRDMYKVAIAYDMARRLVLGRPGRRASYCDFSDRLEKEHPGFYKQQLEKLRMELTADESK